MAEQWNLKDILRGKTTEQLTKRAQELVETFLNAKQELSPSISAQRLLELVELSEEIGNTLQQAYTYHSKHYYANTKDEAAKAAMTSLEQLSTELGNKMIYFSLWFMDVNEKDALRLINSPELTEYKYYLECVRHDKPYTKSEEVEQILNLKSITGRGAFFKVYEVITSGFTYDIDGKVGVTKDEVISYAKKKNPELRAEAYHKLFIPYQEHKAALGELYKNIVLDWNNTGVKIRGYKNALSIRNWANDIEDEAVETLLRVVKKNTSMFQEYFRLKYELNKAAGAQYPYSREHLYAPFERATEKQYTYEEAKHVVLEAYKEYDEEFYDAAQQIFDRQHVDSHPRPNKRGGAFCSWMPYKIYPYILLNHDDSIRDVFTMMHEFGHGIHDVLTHGQPDTLAHPSLPMAETGSILGETILSHKLLKETKDVDERMSMLVQVLDDRWASIVRQSYFVMFEQQAHKRLLAGATMSELDTTYMELLKEQFGEMTIPEEFAQEWNYIPHIHETPFYCYAYAWGNLLALALYKLVEQEGIAGKDKVKTLLSLGGSKSAKEALGAIGIDPKDESFWQGGFDVIQEQIDLLKELAQQEK